MKNGLVYILLFVSLLVNGQARVWVKLGDKSFQKGEFYGASRSYLSAWEEDSTYKGLTYKLALSFKGYQNNERALYYLKKIEKDPTLQIAHPDYLFQLAEVFKGLTAYEKAKTYFAKYLRVNRDTRSFSYLKSKNEVKVYQSILSLLNDTIDVEVWNLGQGINSSGADFYPLWINDSTVIYSSKKAEKMNQELIVEDEEYQVKLFVGAFEDSVWQEKTEVISLDLKGNSFNDGSFDNDRNFYFSKRLENGNHQIVQSRLIIDTIGDKALRLDSSKVIVFSDLDPSYNFRNPFVVEESGKKFLLFSSNRPGGKGGMDLWYSEFKKDVWGLPKSLGTKVNTPGNEIGPHYDKLNKRLFFASDFHYGLGGFDMFEAFGNWRRPTKVKNLGQPLNSSLNDMYFAPFDTLNGLFTSSRIGSVTDKDASCCNDLYAYKFPQPAIDSSLLAITEVLSRDSIMKKLQRLVKEFHVTLYFHNDRPNPNNWDTITPFTYLETYNAYIDSMPTYHTRNTLGKSGLDSIAALDKINGFFDNYVHKGVKDLEVFLGELIKELDAGRRIQLSVKGYASPLAKSDYNVNLTLRRINSLQNYLNRYPGDLFAKYLNGTAENGGLLKIKKVPFGEYRSDSLVSDNYYNTKKSVYSKEASLERKIEIINLELIDDSLVKSEFPMHLDSLSTSYDLGVLDTTVFEWRFDMENKTDEPIKIIDIDPGCHCVTPKRKEWLIEPGETEPLDLQFDLTPYKGKIGRRVVLTLEDGSKRELILLMEVPE